MSNSKLLYFSLIINYYEFMIEYGICISRLYIYFKKQKLLKYLAILLIILYYL